MKKFSKILVLLLSLVAIVTAFTVVAFANEDETPQPFEVLSYDFEEKEAGTAFKDANNKTGRWSVEANPEDANKYLAGYYSTLLGETEGTDNLDVSFEGTWSMGSYFGKDIVDTSSYDIKDYPIFAFDFDMMSPTGNYASAQIVFDFRGSVASDGRLTRLPIYYPSSIGLTKEANVWSHVTAIVEYAGDGVFNTYFYINGEESKAYSIDYKTTNFGNTDAVNKNGPDGQAGGTDTEENKAYAEDNIVNWTDLVDENGNLLYDNIRVAYVVLNPCNNSAAPDDQSCYDNMKFTYYPVGYSVKDVATAVYDGDYRVPYGKTTAQVTDANGGLLASFDSAEKAIAFAGETDIVNIVADTTAIYKVEKKVTIHTNGYAFKCTSDNFIDSNEDANIYEFVTVADLYDGVLLDGDGAYVTFGKNKGFFNGYQNFEAAVQYAIDNAASGKSFKIVLYKDLEYYKGFTFNKTYINLTIDLNGNNLTRVNLYGDVYQKDAEGNDVAQTATTTSLNAFSIPTNNLARYLNFSMTSSKSGGSFKTFTVNGTAYYDVNGNLESYTANTIKTAALIVGGYVQNATISLSEVDIFADNLIKLTDNRNAYIKFTVDNCNFYKTNGPNNSTNFTTDGKPYGYGFVTIQTNATSATSVVLNFSNSLFYFSNKIINNYASYNMISAYDDSKVGVASINFDNCDFISETSAANFGISVTNKSLVTFNDCRLSNVYYAGTTVNYATLGEGNIMSSVIETNSIIADGCIVANKLQTKIYKLPTASNVSLNKDGNGLMFDFGFTDKVVTFEKRVGLSTDLVEVEWLGVDGEVLATTEEFKGDVATIPSSITKVPSGNGYTAFTNPVWLNADGKEDLTLNGSEYNFTAALPANPEYVAYVTDILFNMTYMDMFTYRLYVPVVDGVEITMLGAYAPGSSSFGKVMVDGKEYYTSVAAWRSVNRAADSQTARIQFKAHGQSFEYLDTNGDGTKDTDTSAKVNLSALLYAEIVSADNSFSAVEKDAVLKMMAYIEQIYVIDNFTGSATQDTFNNFFGTYYNTEDPTARPAAEAYDQTVYSIVDGYSTYVKQFNYAIYAGGRLSFGVTLLKSAVDAGYTLDIDAGVCNGFSKKVTNADGTVTYYTWDISLTYVMLADNYKIYVKNAEGEVVATQDYNLATYCASLPAQDKALPNALYTFGKAVLRVREYLSTL